MKPVRVDRRDVHAAHAVQRRTLAVLGGGQVLGGIGIGVGFAVGALLAQEISGSAGLAGLALTVAMVGAAAMAVPLARLSDARGRRIGLAVGYALGALGSALVVAASALDNYPLLVVGMAAFGACMAAGFQARFAATDLAEPHRAARDLSLVVWASAVGTVAGPNLAEPAERLADAVGARPLAGSFLGAAVVLLAAAVLLLALLRPDPLLAARAERGPVVAAAPRAGLRDSLRVIRASPLALFGLVVVTAAHAVMLSVMTMTPVHMHDGGAELRVVGLVISVHVAGMYGLAPLVGLLCDRLGRVQTAGFGAGVFAVALTLAGTAEPDQTVQLTAGLFLLGLGWSCSLIAGSTLLTAGVDAAARPGVQGAADLIMQSGGATGSAVGGVVMGLGGYPVLAVVAAVPVAVAALGALRVWRSSPDRA